MELRGAKLDDIIERLRLQTVPRNYMQTIHTWTEGTMFFNVNIT